MPSISSLIASAVTMTSLVSAMPGDYATTPNVIGPIEALCQCSQTIIFEKIDDSTCSPSDFPCICAEFTSLGIREAIATGCTPPELPQWDNFFAEYCPVSRQDNTTVVNVTSTVVPVLPINTGSSSPNVTVIPGPWYNTTVATGTGVPVVYVTSEVVIPTTAANGVPTVITSKVVEPAGAPTAPPGPEYTGAAAAFGARSGMFVGAIGIMGLVFAEL